ncbi:MAG: NUDIX domain-containing protein [Spirochaetia bacterium]|nr:NUDIX domain-containing protein [Spirochaetia bacterium]
MDGNWKPAERAVITYIFKDDKVLLIVKKRGLGKGKVNAPGGRIEKGETPVQAAVRECREEIGLTPEDPVLVGTLDFAFADGYSLGGYVFKATSYSGTLAETDEADPFWCPVSEMPYDRMWADDRLWLPALLDGKYFSGQFTFDGDSMTSGGIQVFDKKKKILCYGSSSTWGYDWQGGGRFDEETRWPCVMKKYIPACFEVTEDGVCGRTVLNYMPGDEPTNGIQALEKRTDLAEYDGVMIMLGNNDTMASSEVSVAAIADGMGTMAEILRAKNKNIRIFLTAPVPISTNCNEDDLFFSFFESQVNKSRSLPAEIMRVAEKYGCTFIEAGRFVSCDGTDGIHFDGPANRYLGLCFADFINRTEWN